jgi:hypothetical protein
MIKFRILAALLVALFIQTAVAQTDSLLLRLKGLPNVIDVTPIKPNSHFKSAYMIMIDQPVDHDQPNGRHFQQRIFLSHSDFLKPVIFVTEGYQADYAQNPFYSEELSQMLGANQIVVEHRYFGKSVPTPLDWKYMNIKNAAADHHLIVGIFKALYPGKWISTGISKGGQTSIYFRYFYPDDVDATVAYVAPINFALEDPREEIFLKNVGPAEVRDKIEQFQKLLFQHKKELLPEFEKKAQSINATFHRFGLEAAFDQTILEYPFSYWQWGHSESEIPDQNANNESLLDALLRTVPAYTFSDSEITKFEPFFAQANGELGYYGYDLTPFKKWLKQKSYPNSVLGPQNLPVNYTNVPMKKVDEWLRTKAERLICIYGEWDPWSASAARIENNPNTLKLYAAKGCHASRISTLSVEQKASVVTKLHEWLGLPISDK